MSQAGQQRRRCLIHLACVTLHVPGSPRGGRFSIISYTGRRGEFVARIFLGLSQGSCLPCRNRNADGIRSKFESLVAQYLIRIKTVTFSDPSFLLIK